MGTLKSLLTIGVIVGVIGGIIAAGIQHASGKKQTCTREENVQALCIHLNEKWRAEGKDWFIPMKDCKARMPLKATTPAARI